LPTITINGGNDKTATLTAADLSKLPQHTIKTAEHDTPQRFTAWS